MAEKPQIELTITKSRAIKAAGEYVRAEYTLKAVNLDPGELDAARISLESKIDVWLSELKPSTPAPKPSAPMPPPAAAPMVAPTPAPAPTPMPHPSTFFPKELVDLLSFEDHGDYWIVKPHQFLGAENFAKVAQIVRSHQGEYVSAGKESHFKIPKQGVSQVA